MIILVYIEVRNMPLAIEAHLKTIADKYDDVSDHQKLQYTYWEPEG